MKNHNHYFTLLLFVLILCCASCGKPKLKSNPDEADSIAIVTEKEAKSSSEKSSFPQITAFTDYVYEDHFVYTFTETRGILRQLDIEFPTGMKNKKVLARIQEQLIDTLFHEHYHTIHLDTAMSKYWPLEPKKLKRLTTYPQTVPNDSDEYFDYGGVDNIHFEHLCGRTSYNQNALYIMRHHFVWYDGG